jgi:hypothetical protein
MTSKAPTGESAMSNTLWFLPYWACVDMSLSQFDWMLNTSKRADQETGE